MGTLMAYGPDVVGLQGTSQYGLYKLWENPSKSATFAAQTITINNFDKDKFDSIIISIAELFGEKQNGSKLYEFDTELFSDTPLTSVIYYTAMAANNTQLQFDTHSRSITITLTGTTLQIDITDNYRYMWTGSGTPAKSLNNALNIPVRILGLIHNN